MNGIIIITTDSLAKRAFANRLHKRSGGRVDLVIVQQTHCKPLHKRILGYVRKVGILGLPREIWFTLLWLFLPRVRRTHSWLKARSENNRAAISWVPKTVTVESVNTDKVREIIAAYSPKLIVIWGGMIVKTQIINLASHVINMHFGWCPYYRGTHCNHHAILKDDWERVGITIHYAVKAVDAGEIIAVIPGDPAKRPIELFQDLNNRAEAMYLNIALRLLKDERVSSKSQDLSQGKNYLLKEWTYERRYRLGKLLLERTKKRI
ncbi:hypothetical protein CL630_02565 [bacterium]|nr:hypothetical protein [bacterium]|tara:strand:- start:24058 stop:24849 length:792 start_codon:yes stop_codon:yes gene_type:complete